MLISMDNLHIVGFLRIWLKENFREISTLKESETLFPPLLRPRSKLDTELPMSPRVTAAKGTPYHIELQTRA